MSTWFSAGVACGLKLGTVLAMFKLGTSVSRNQGNYIIQIGTVVEEWFILIIIR